MVLKTGLHGYWDVPVRHPVFRESVVQDDGR